MKIFWIIWNPAANRPTVMHETLDSAKKEAERLAKLNPGQRFVVLKSIEFCEVHNPVKWTKTDDIPF
jgi:hypothetical protein